MVRWFKGKHGYIVHRKSCSTFTEPIYSNPSAFRRNRVPPCDPTEVDWYTRLRIEEKNDRSNHRQIGEKVMSLFVMWFRTRTIRA